MDGLFPYLPPVFPATKSATNGQLSLQSTMSVRQSIPLAIPADGFLPRSTPQIHLCCRAVRCRKVSVPNRAADHILQTSVGKNITGTQFFSKSDACQSSIYCFFCFSCACFSLSFFCCSSIPRRSDSKIEGFACFLISSVTVFFLSA